LGKTLKRLIALNEYQLFIIERNNAADSIKYTHIDLPALQTCRNAMSVSRSIPIMLTHTSHR